MSYSPGASSDSSFSWHPSEAELEHSPSRQREPQPQQASPSVPQSHPHPPRLSSPRIFRSIFNEPPHMTDRDRATRALADIEGMADVSRHIDSASQALQNAQAAFQTRRSSTIHSVVDLTNSPPGGSSQSSRFMSRTTHPHDARPSRRMDALNQPVYGARTLPSVVRRISPQFEQFDSSYDHSGPLAPIRRHIPPEPEPEFDPSDSGARARMRRIQNTRSTLAPIPIWHTLVPSDRQQRLQEEHAVRRQQEARAQWAQVERRAAERQQRDGQSSSPPQPRHQSQPRLSTPKPTTMDSPTSEPEVEAVDLTQVEDSTSLAAALSKQRQDAVASQNTMSSESGRTTLSAYKCPICMETPVNATSTICGHLFCHQCIISTLKWSENQRREDAPPGRRVKGVCPVCRKELARNENVKQGRTLVPLEIKLTVKKRKRDDKGKGKVVDVETMGREQDGNEKSKRAKVQKQRCNSEDIWGEFIHEDA